MKCNNCEAELEEGVTLCPNCGCDNTPAEEAAESVAEETAYAVETIEETTEQEAPTGEAPAEESSVEETAASENPETTPIVEGKLTPGKIALLVVLAVAAIALVIALVVGGLGAGQTDESTEPTSASENSESTETVETVETTEATIPADGNPDDVTCKGTYTTTDEEAAANKATVVATLGDSQLTNAELNVYYWMQFYDFNSSYGSYASYLGVDFSQPMDTQLSPEGNTTWQQYILSAALDSWHTYAALSMEADKAGFEMDAEFSDYLASLPDSMESSAVSAGFENAQEMLEADMGAGVDLDAYLSYMNEYYKAYLYYSELYEAIEVTEDEIVTYFDENASAYAENGVEKNDEAYVDVRHILVMPTGGTTDDSGNTTYSEEEWEECRASAQAILDEWKAGEANEESFAALANEYSEDGGSNTNGGLYENVYVGQMVEPFETWCFDESRQYGDTGLVQTEYGYHVMFYVDSTPVWYETAQSDLYTEKSNKIMEDAMSAYERNVDYGSISLGQVDLSTSTEE